MPVYAGGLRQRLIKDNLENMLRDSLDALHWFDTGRSAKPLKFSSTQTDLDTTIEANIAVLSPEDRDDENVELGSNLTEDTWFMVVDIIAENEAIGIHLAGDIEDIIRGKYPSIGRNRPSFDVYDLIENPLSKLFMCELEFSGNMRNRTWNEPSKRFAWSVGFEVIDEFYSDDGYMPMPQDSILDGGIPGSFQGSMLDGGD